MPLPKPTSKPLWAKTNPAVRVEPTGAKKETAWGIDERPPREFMNWLFYNIGVEWLEYLESVTDTMAGIFSTYQAFVGSGVGFTHADLNAVMADGAIAAGANIFVQSPATLNTVQQITKHRVQIVFHPGAIYTKGTAANALEINADYVRIVGGQFDDWTGGGVAPIKILSGSDHTKILGSHFKTCNDIDDLASTTSVVGTTEEA